MRLLERERDLKARVELAPSRVTAGCSSGELLQDETWRQDSNLHPPGPEPGDLPLIHSMQRATPR